LILYDESYNFLGMSEKILNKLGYDDLDEFCTYHRDFAELFEKQNGLIYNFENFSWIDFVLYGGANKDQAIVKTKTGDKIKAKIEIDEIRVKDDIIGVTKIFSVNLIEQGIIKETSSTIPITANKINLSAMLDEKDILKDDTPEPKIEIVQENSLFGDVPKTDTTDKEQPIIQEQKEENIDINLSFIKNEELKEDDKSTKPSFSFDFLKKDEDQDEKEDEQNKPQTPPIVEETPAQIKEDKEDDDQKVVLNFFNSTLDEEKEEEKSQEEITPLQPQIQPQEQTIQPQETPLNDIKTEEEPKETKKDDKPFLIDLNILNKDKQDTKTPSLDDTQEDDEPKIELNFLKQDPQEESDSDLKSKTDSSPTINLNFLKGKDEEETEEEENDLYLKIKPTVAKEESDKDQDDFSADIKLFKIDAQKEEKQTKPEEKSPSIDINMNFLKQDPDSVEDKNTQEDKAQEQEKDEPLINLNFLKQEEEPTIEIEKQDKAPSDLNLNFLKIDEQKEEKQEEKDENISINLDFFKKEAQEKQVLDIEPEKKSKIINKIKEDINEIDNQNKQKEEEIVINDALKSILNIVKPNEEKEDKKPKEPVIKIIKEQKQEKPVKPTVQKPVTTAQPEKKVVQKSQPKIKITQVENEQTAKKELLPNLDISRAQKVEIIQDFINDATYNLSLISKYFELKDLESIKYLAVKIKSAAEILGLSDITNNVEQILSNSGDFQSIKNNLNNIIKSIEDLKQYL